MLKYKETTSIFSVIILAENFVLNCVINILFDVFISTNMVSFSL